MSLIEKLKNVFFEEVEEDEDEDEIPQTFAKKVEIPKKKIEVSKVEKSESNEKKVEEQKEIKPQENNRADTFIEVEEQDNSKVIPMMFDDDDFQEDDNIFVHEESKDDKDDEVIYKRETINNDIGRDVYSIKKESYVESIDKKPVYSYTKTTHYEEEKKVFKPSPIISPIYGILDKNYRKEEVITKRETRISTSTNRPDLDSVRNKAFNKTSEVKVEPQKNNHEEEKKKVYDVNNDKPHVNKVTLADAEEYYNDLGLAYNVDYSDASKNNDTRSSKYSRDKKRSKKEEDDNLFDLIDSMYSKED